MAKTKASTRKPAAKGGRPSSAPPPARPGKKAWIINFALAAAFLGFLAYLYRVPSHPGEPVPSKPVPAEKKATPASKPEQEAPATIEYRYIDRLPNDEVVAPNVEDYRPSNNSKKTWYRLQTGSFRSAEQAETQKAQIAFLGIRATTKPVTGESGQTWYRVEIGPIQSRSQMNRVVDQLVELNIRPIVRKVDPE